MQIFPIWKYPHFCYHDLEGANPDQHSMGGGGRIPLQKRYVSASMCVSQQFSTSQYNKYTYYVWYYL